MAISPVCRRLGLLPAVGIGFEVLIDALGVVIGIVASDARILLPGAIIRLAAILVLLVFATRGRIWAWWAIVGIEWFTALMGVALMLITFTDKSIAPGAAWVVMGIVLMYVAIGAAIQRGIARGSPTVRSRVRQFEDPSTQSRLWS